MTPLDETPIPLIDPSDLPRPAAHPELDAKLERVRRILSGDIRKYDYLPIPSKVRAAVERDLQAGRDQLGGANIAPELEVRQLRQRLLSFHHGGSPVCYIEDIHGIIVLAVGYDTIEPVVRAFAGAWREPLSVATPEQEW